MPIDKAEFQNGKGHNEVETNILAFLKERKENAFTSHEIMEGVQFHTNFSTSETIRISTFATADFSTLLHQLVADGKVQIKIIENQIYFAAGADIIAKCPKCEREIAEPKKTWKMTSHPDKKGQRLVMNIGLFKCPMHGNFRIALSKQKI